MNRSEGIRTSWMQMGLQKERRYSIDVRLKARLVANGFSQKEVIDYNKIISPVVKHSSSRVLLALVAQFYLEQQHLDVKMSFLHGDLEETIYMDQLEGFLAEGKEDHVCQLTKSL